MSLKVKGDQLFTAAAVWVHMAILQLLSFRGDQSLVLACAASAVWSLLLLVATVFKAINSRSIRTHLHN